MAETPTARRWLGRLTYLVIAIGLIFTQLLPLETLPRAFAPPDLILAITLVWVARRPDFLPVPLIALVFLGSDLLFQRPPGLWTALVLILTEIIRARASGLRSAPFGLEWATVAMGIFAITMVNRAALATVMTPQAPLTLSLIQMAMTILAYPAVVGIAYLLLGVHRPAPGAVDGLGHRV